MRTHILQKRFILLPIALMAILLVSTLLVGFGVQPEKAYAVALQQCDFLDPSEGTREVCVNFATTAIAECTGNYGDDRTNEDWLFCEQRATAYINENYLSRAPPVYKTVKCDVIQDSTYDNCVARIVELRQACQAKYNAGSADLDYCYDRVEETVYVEEICITNCNYYAEIGVYGTTADSGGPGFGDDDSDGEPEKQSCEDNDGEFVFFQCAIIGGASEAVNELDDRVRSALEVKPQYYENDGLKGAWSNFRNIAYILLIPVMLVMVIGTALGFGFVDAYTVKRALPRLLVAIIFIALSYQICVLMVEVVGVVGRGTAGLIAAPFGGADELTLTKIFNPSKLSGATALGTGVIGGIALLGIGAVSLGIIASYLLVAALALIIIFALLTMREVIIVFLIVLAPLAMISWIFQGNDKMWKLWWSSFSKLLYIYPIIIALLVTGRAFAFIISDLEVEGIEAVFLSFAKLVAYIGPFFFIPKAFQLAGGAFANLAGMANNTGKGVFDRQRKYRGEQKQKTKEKARAGNRFGNTPGLRRLNNITGKGFAAKDAGLSALRRGGIASQYAKNTSAAGAEFGEKNADYAHIKADDEILAASLMDTDDDIKAKLQNLDRFKGADGNYDSKHDGEVNQYLQSIKSAKSGAGKNAYKKAAIQDLAKAGTYFRDAGHLAEMVNEAYGDDRSGAGAAMMAAKSASMSAGRVDIGGAGAGDTLGALGAHYDATKGVSKADNLAAYADASAAASDRVLKGVVKSQGPQALAHSSMKRGAVEAVMPELKARLQEAYQKSPEAYNRELAAVANLYDTMSATSPQNADIVAEQLLGADLTGAGINIQQQIEASRNDPTFVQYRREYPRPEQDQSGRIPTDLNVPPGGSAGGGSFL